MSVFLVPLFYVMVRKVFKESAHEHEIAVQQAAAAGMMADDRTESEDNKH